MNYVPELSGIIIANSEYISHLRAERKGAEFLSVINKHTQYSLSHALTNKHANTQLYALVQV